MHRRLGATGIFVEVNGRYYLDEAKLNQVQERRRAWEGGMGGGGMGGGGPRGSMVTVRIVRMMVGLAAVVLAVTNILFVRDIDLSLVVVGPPRPLDGPVGLPDLLPLEDEAQVDVAGMGGGGTLTP